MIKKGFLLLFLALCFSGAVSMEHKKPSFSSASVIKQPEKVRELLLAQNSAVCEMWHYVTTSKKNPLGALYSISSGSRLANWSESHIRLITWSVLESVPLLDNSMRPLIELKMDHLPVLRAGIVLEKEKERALDKEIETQLADYLKGAVDKGSVSNRAQELNLYVNAICDGLKAAFLDYKSNFQDLKNMYYDLCSRLYSGNEELISFLQNPRPGKDEKQRFDEYRAYAAVFLAHKLRLFDHNNKNSGLQIQAKKKKGKGPKSPVSRSKRPDPIFVSCCRFLPGCFDVAQAFNKKSLRERFEALRLRSDKFLNIFKGWLDRNKKDYSYVTEEIFDATVDSIIRQYATGSSEEFLWPNGLKCADGLVQNFRQDAFKQIEAVKNIALQELEDSLRADKEKSEQYEAIHQTAAGIPLEFVNPDLNKPIAVANSLVKSDDLMSITGNSRALHNEFIKPKVSQQARQALYGIHWNDGREDDFWPLMNSINYPTVLEKSRQDKVCPQLFKDPFNGIKLAVLKAPFSGKEQKEFSTFKGYQTVVKCSPQFSGTMAGFHKAVTSCSYTPACFTWLIAAEKALMPYFGPSDGHSAYMKSQGRDWVLRVHRFSYRVDQWIAKELEALTNCLFIGTVGDKSDNTYVIAIKALVTDLNTGQTYPAFIEWYIRCDQKFGWQICHRNMIPLIDKDCPVPSVRENIKSAVTDCSRLMQLGLKCMRRLAGNLGSLLAADSLDAEKIYLALTGLSTYLKLTANKSEQPHADVIIAASYVSRIAKALEAARGGTALLAKTKDDVIDWIKCCSKSFPLVEPEFSTWRNQLIEDCYELFDLIGEIQQDLKLAKEPQDQDTKYGQMIALASQLQHQRQQDVVAPKVIDRHRVQNHYKKPCNQFVDHTKKREASQDKGQCQPEVVKSTPIEQKEKKRNVSDDHSSSTSYLNLQGRYFVPQVYQKQFVYQPQFVAYMIKGILVDTRTGFQYFLSNNRGYLGFICDNCWNPLPQGTQILQ